MKNLRICWGQPSPFVDLELRLGVVVGEVGWWVVETGIDIAVSSSTVVGNSNLLRIGRSTVQRRNGIAVETLCVSEKVRWKVVRYSRLRLQGANFPYPGN